MASEVRRGGGSDAGVADDGFYRMTPLETAWGWVPGGLIEPMAPLSPAAQSPLQALEDVIRPALERPPCIVQFSGGRDSSVILAVALRLARREGHPEPIPLTRRFPGLIEADEDEWQDEVIGFLGIRHWERIDIGDEMDIVGPVAGPSLLRHGLLWSPLTHLRLFDFAQASGGSTLDGEGGDELFGPGRLAPFRALATRRLRPSPRNLAIAGLGIANRRARQVAYRQLYRRRLDLPWLRSAAALHLQRALAADAAEEPADWRRSVMRHRSIRGVALYRKNRLALAAESDVVDVHPLLSAPVIAAVAVVGGRFGFSSRTQAMRLLFKDLLPDAILSRSTKTRFNRAGFNEHSRAFAASWDGTGVDDALVDADALRRTWQSEEPHGMSFALLQACWLASQR